MSIPVSPPAPEIRRKNALPDTPIASFPEAAAEIRIFPVFFRAGIAAVLTTGCLLGAIALLGVALRQSYTVAAWTPYILAHVNSQLYGWVGLFVMGFALQHHPPRVSHAALFHRLAHTQLALLLIAVVVRFVAEPLAAPTAPPDLRTIGIGLGVFTGVLQAFAVALFIMNIGLTRYRGRDGSGLPWQSRFVFASLGWWLLAAVVEPRVFLATHGADAGANAAFIAARFVPYREAQFLGFVPMMIFGVALARFSAEFGLRFAHRAPALAGFALWNLALLVRMAGWTLWSDTGAVAGLSLYHAGGMLLAVAATLLVFALRIFARREPDAVPSAALWFIRTAFVWLLLAGALTAAEPFALAGLQVPFSHAYTGAIRHALTVGFISQMIVGVALHVVPRWMGKPAGGAWTAPLLLVYPLLNLGNLLRVALEIATDHTPSAFAPMGVTGFVELVALSLWAAHVLRELRRPRMVSVPAGSRVAQR
jgi:hypothetical protein